MTLPSVFVFLLLGVDISQRAKPICLMLQIRNTLRRLWQISARLGCQIKKNEEVEAQSIGIHPTVSKCRLSALASLQYEINQIQQRPILLFFCLSRQIQLEWTSNSMFSQIPPEAVCLRHALIHYSAVYQEGAINIGNIFFPIKKKTWIKPQTTYQYNSLMKHIIWHIKSHASSNLGVAICGASRVTLVDRAKGLKKKWKEIFWKRSKCQREMQRGTRRGRDVSAQTGNTTGAAVRC